MQDQANVSAKTRAPCIPICIVGIDGRIRFCNNAFTDFLKTAPGSIIGRTCLEALNCTAEDSRRCPLSRIKAHFDRTPVTIRRSVERIRETAEPVLDDAGRIAAVMLSFPHDFHSPHSGNDLIKLQKLETVAQAASGIVHDLNNILMCVNSEVCILKNKLEALSVNHDTSETITSLLSILSRGYGLTNQLLKLSKGRKPDTGLTAIGPIITEAVHFSLIGSHIKSKIEISNDLLPVHVNSDQIFQIVSNLVINARHATDPNRGVQIEITADNMQASEIQRIGLKSQKGIFISVKDAGQGISPEQLDHIFEPFYTTKPDGTGLGLSLVNLIVRELSGQITVESTVGKGSNFTVYIPALDLNVP